MYNHKLIPQVYSFNNTNNDIQTFMYAHINWYISILRARFEPMEIIVSN
jgi:hypothetical protein